MPEEIKDLIAKIKSEGIKAAQDESSRMELQAKALADKILNEAKAEAERIIQEAEREAQKHKSSTEALLKQSARDMLLSLKKEISAMLDKVVKNNLRFCLGTPEMLKIISALIMADKHKENIVVSLKEEDLNQLREGLMAQLSEETRKRVILKGSDEISAGFTISYDAGKSLFDFSEAALAEYISTYIKPELNSVLGKSDSHFSEK